MSGWVKLHRSLKDWEWYDDINCVLLLIHLLVSVNHKDKKWRGVLIKSGSIVLSWKTLAKESKMSIQQCRTAMLKLETSGEVTRKATNKYQLITLVKWEKLQSNNNQLTNNTTNKQQTTNKQLTTTKEYKEYKELKEDKKEVFFSWIEYRKEIKKPITAKSTVQSLIKKFNAENLTKCKSVVNASIENNWQGLFWDKVNVKNNKPTKPIF